MGATAAITAGAGMAYSAYTKIRAGNEQKNLAENNAAIAELQAEDAIARGEVEVGRQQMVTRRTVGNIRTKLAAQGIEVDRGSAEDVVSDARHLGALDVITIRNNAAREAWGYRVQAQDYRARGKIAAQTGVAEGVGTILTGAGSLLLSKYGGGSGKEKV